MPFAPPNWLAFSQLLAHDLHLGAWTMGAVVASGALLWWRRWRRENGDDLDLAS